ncbi:MAG TPA: ATP-binding protein [Acidimicrobiales bacterium]|nr:ATP-binding protein [Acidimicrobiales bacterium]
MTDTFDTLHSAKSRRALLKCNTQRQYRLLKVLSVIIVSSRYEHASLIQTSNLPFASWGEVFGDQVVAAAMIDRIVHHAKVITLNGSSYRLRDSGLTNLPSVTLGAVEES